ncbi:MAG TPA: hypothetical protein VIY48_08940, partial [Candidatus Paceibacterota bacterium]
GSGGSDMAQQLLQIAGTLAQSPKGAALMQTAIQSLMGGGGGDGMLNKMATAQAGDPRAMAIPGGGMPANAGTDIEGRGPTTDMDLMNVSQANQGVRGNLPPQYSPNDYTGYASEMAPQPDPRQTPMPSDEQMLEKARLGMGAAPGRDPQIVKEMVKAGMDPSDPKQIQQFIKQNGDGDGNDSEGTTEDQYEGDNGGPRSGTGNNPRNGGSYSLVPGGRK